MTKEKGPSRTVSVRIPVSMYECMDRVRRDMGTPIAVLIFHGLDKQLKSMGIEWILGADKMEMRDTL